MTDPEFADRTYVEPLTPESVRADHRARTPDALLPTLGGQTALNLAKELHDDGTLKRFDVELIGAELRRDPPRGGPRGIPQDDGGRRTARAVVDDRRVGRRGGGRLADGSIGCRRSSGPPSRWADRAGESGTRRPSCSR